MLNEIIELDPNFKNLYGDVISGHSCWIADILNGYITNFDDIIKDEVIKAKVVSEIANHLLNEGLAKDFMLEVWQKRYSGNEGLGKTLNFSFACGRCITPECHGLGQFVRGPAEYGKSAAIMAYLNLVDQKYVVLGSASDKADFYDKIEAGAIRYTEEETDFKDIKESWTNFQSGNSRRTTQKVEENFITEKHNSPGRLTHWCTSVNFNADNEIKSRFDITEVVATKEALNRINKFNDTKASGKYQTPIEYDIETLICRAITGILGPLTFDVVIPYAERLDWGNTSPRTTVLFRDTIRASAIWNYAKRSTDKYGRLEANEEDFYQALDKYESIGGTSTNKFSNAEISILQSILNAPGRSKSAPKIQNEIKMSRQQFNQVIYGRDSKKDQQKYGLEYKCNGMLRIHNEKIPYIFELDKDFSLDCGIQVKLRDKK